jgi:hypothetical protein
MRTIPTITDVTDSRQKQLGSNFPSNREAEAVDIVRRQHVWTRYARVYRSTNPGTKPGDGREVTVCVSLK